MATKTKNKKTTKLADSARQRRTAQILFAIFALILILSMVLSAVAKY
jgi:predicted nucleic acid-binding Zn ribbon protein